MLMKPKKQNSFSKAQLINISQFKAEALKLLADTAEKGKEYVITKKGLPIARVVPFATKSGTRRGSLKGLIEIKGDIVNFDTSADWEVLN